MFFAKKKKERKERKPSGGQASGWACRTRVKISGSISYKRREHLDLCGKVCNLRSCLQLLSLNTGSTLGHKYDLTFLEPHSRSGDKLVGIRDNISPKRDWGFKINIDPTQWDLRIFAQNFLKVCLRLSAIGSSEKKRKKKVSLRKRLPIVDLFVGLSSVGTRFRHWRCHPLPVFMTVGMILNLWHSSRQRRRHSWRT